jgi:hypothetical protein
MLFNAAIRHYMINIDTTSYNWIFGTFLVALIDFVIIFLSFNTPKVKIETARNFDYAILVPIFNKIEYLKNIPFLAEQSCNIYILTTNRETPEFNESLEKICNLNNFKLFKADIDINREKTPWLLFSIALHGKSNSLDMISNKHLILIDGDTYSNDDLDTLVCTMDKNMFDVASVKILPDLPLNILKKLQYIEYSIAMQARTIFPYLTSGAALIGKREVLKRIYARHSMYFQGGDIEVGILAKRMGFKINYIPFEFYTEVPAKVLQLSKQRLSWASGTFRLFVVNIFQTLRNHPWEVFYTIVLIYTLLYLKILNMILYFPIIFITCYLSYIIFLTIVTLKDFNIAIILAPLYSLLQAFLFLPLGCIIYCRRVLLSRNLGLISSSNPRRNIKLLVGNHSLYSNALELNGS